MRNRIGIKRELIYFLICASSFFAVTMPFRKFFSVSGVTEVRPASALPPVMGILFGPWGALGAAAGNLLADALSGDSPGLCLTGLVAQFLYGYIPYKLWYAPPFSNSPERVQPRLDAVKSVARYIAIVLFNSALTAAFIGFLTEAFGLGGFLSMTTLMIFFNNFVFSMMLGIPLFILITGKKGMVLLPPAKTKAPAENAGTACDLFLLLSFCSVGGYTLLSATGHARGGIFFAVFAYGCAIVYARKPICGKMGGRPEKQHRISLNEKLILAFLLIGTIMSLTTGAVAFMESAYRAESLVCRWNRIYLYVSADMSIFYLITLAILWYAEKRITVPISELADIAVNYVKKDRRGINRKSVFRQCSKFSGDGTEIGCLARSFLSMSNDIERYVDNITKITAEKERIGAELSVATQIQSSMLPSTFPAFPDREEFDIYAVMKPAREVGGDFYDFFLIDEDHFALVIADVSGKGIPAALFMMTAKTLIKNQTQLAKSPAEVFTAVNGQLCENNETGMFVTAFLGVLEIRSGRFTYVNAGHNPPLVKKPDGGFEWLKAKPGFVLGGMEGVRYRQAELAFGKGDLFFAYTDGVTEALNPSQELYGDPRLSSALNRGDAGQTGLRGLLEYLQADLDRFSAGAEQADDITMLVLKYIGGK